jgi:hypothetical protein
VPNGITQAALLALPVAIAVAVAAAGVILLRRTGVLAAESRQASAARNAVARLDARTEEVLGPLIAKIDQARRGQMAAEGLGEEIAATSEATAELIEAGRALEVPLALADVRAGMVAELERAGRALEMVEHGRSIMASARARGRELEAQTAVKRGYLNLLHAREAVGRYAARAAAYRSPTEARRDARRGY